MYNNYFKLAKPTSNGHETEFSAGPINWVEAQAMIQQYRSNPYAVQVPVNLAGKITPTQLKGFRIDKADILEIFNSDSTIDELFIMFAVRQEDLEKDHSDQYFTTILGGIKGNAFQHSVLFDFVDPCPDHCPSGIL